MLLNSKQYYYSFLTFLLLFSVNCYSVDLVDIYKLAEKSDPTYLQEIASYRATLESRPQSLSQLLPSVNLDVGTRWIDQDISSSENFGRRGEISFKNKGYTLSLTQPLFRRDRFIALAQAGSEINQAEAELAEAQQELIIRIADRYFDVLASIDDLEFAKSELISLSRQLEQAEQRFEVGLSDITDVQEAKAGHDLAIAREIQSLNAIDNAHEAIRELTGEYITAFDGLGDDMVLTKPDPDVIEDWTQLALEQNLGVIAANHATETAKKEIKRQAAGHYPTLDIVASKDYDSSGGRFGESQTHATAVGLELNVPLFSGGLTSSQTREAHENYNIAMHALDQARRSAQRLTRQAYLGVISGISQVKALKQAVISSETALEATEAGFEVGTRTSVDVVAAQRSVSEARRDYSQARYEYILDTLRLKQAAGTLAIEDLQSINTWLTK